MPEINLLRRDVLKLGALSAGALAAPQFVLAADAARNTDTLVVVFLRGAMDGLSAVVPYTDSNYYLNRRSTAIAAPGAATAASIDLDGRYALHPALAPLKAIWDRSELSIVHAVGLSTPSRSHFDAQDFMERAWLEKGTVFSGWLNRHLASSAGASDSTFRGISVGRAVTKSLGGAAPVVGLNSIATFGLNTSSTRKSEISEALQASFSGAGFLDSTGQRTFAALDELVEINPSAIGVENAAAYPNTTFGKQMQDLAALIKSGIGVEVATCDLGGWDTHNNQPNELNAKFDELSKTLAAFHTDLGARMGSVTVLTMTEFGRRVAENGSQGTDHGRASCMFAMGGGVIGKQIYADWPGLAAAQLEGGDLRVTTDYRAVLAEVLTKRCGNTAGLASIFPGYTGGATRGLFATRS